MRAQRLAFYQGVAAGLLLAIAARDLLSLLFHASLATFRLNPTAFWAIALATPLLASVVRSPRWPLLVGAVATGALPFSRFGTWHLEMAGLAAAGSALALATLRGRGLAGAVVGVALAGGVLVALDSRGLPYFTAGAALAALGALAFAPADDEEPRLARAGLAWGIVLAVELALLASPYALARHASLPPWLAALAGSGGLVVGATLLPRAGRWLPLVGVVGALDVAFVQSPLAAPSVAALQASLGAALVRAGPPRGEVLALVLAPALFALTFFLGAIPEWPATLSVLALLPLALAWPRREVHAHRSRGAVAALAVLLALAFVPSKPVVEPAGRELTVVSWNVHQGFGNRGGLDPDLFLDVLRSLDADVVLLQETARGELSSGGLDSVLHLAGALGMHAAYGAPGVAVLSRFPLGEDERPATGDWTLEAPIVVDGATVWVHSVHLSRSTQGRAQQAQAILDAARERPGPRILAGDLNSCPAATCFGGRPSDGVHQTLAAVYTDAWSALHGPTDPAGNTHPAWNPTRRIDVVMVTGFEVLEAGPLRDERTVLGSDHLPNVVRLRLP